VGEQVAEGRVLAGVRVLQREARQVRDGRRVPGEFLLVDEGADRSGSDVLGDGCDLKARVGVDRCRSPDLPDAEAFQVDHAVVLDDADDGAGHAVLGHRPVDEIVESVEFSGLPGRGDRARAAGAEDQADREAGRDEQQCAGRSGGLHERELASVYRSIAI